MSKGLEALLNLYARASIHCPINELDIILSEHNIIEKILKAFDIIKTKQVDFKTFMFCATLPIVDVKTRKLNDDLQLEAYNGAVFDNTKFASNYVGYDRCLTKEEFDLLKELL